MAKTLAELHASRPVDPDLLAKDVAALRERQRAWQLRELREQAGLTLSRSGGGCGHREGALFRGGRL